MKRFLLAGLLFLTFALAPVTPFVSFQGHWTPGTMDFVNPVTAHTHVDIGCELPPYSIINSPLRCELVVKLFQTEGEVGGVFAGVLQGTTVDIIWDATGSTVRPIMRGDPNHHALKQWSGHFTALLGPDHPHGWLDVTTSVKVFYDNGDSVSVDALVPYFSTFDPSVPVDWAPPMMASRVSPHTFRRPDILFGANQMDLPGLNTFPPTLDMVRPITISAIRYGTLSNLPVPTFKMVRDLDLHNDVSGTTVKEIVNPPDFNNIVLDPADFGTGSHKVAMIFTQPDGGIEQVASLVVRDILVGAGAPPPPPPPPTVDEWRGATPIFQEHFLNGTSTGKFRICFGPICIPLN